MLTTLNFSYEGAYRESSMGIELPVTIRLAPREVRFSAKLDTGATFCIFQREHAEELGIDIEAGEPKRFQTATGLFKAYGHSVELSSCGFDLDALVYFSEAYNFPRNVLGLQGWFDQLRFGLVHHDGALFLARYDD